MNKSTHPTHTYNEKQLLDKAVTMIDTLSAGDKVKAKNLIESDLWKSQSLGLCSKAGGSIKRLVELNLLPLEYIGKDSSNHCQYRVL